MKLSDIFYRDDGYEPLRKAVSPVAPAAYDGLYAGYGTDSALFMGGRALIPEDMEGTMISCMREQPEIYQDRPAGR